MAYITVADLRNEGVADPPYSTEHVEERITLACAAIDQMTSCFFEARAAHVVQVNGRGHDTLFLPYPPCTESSITKVELRSVSASGSTWAEVDADLYEVVMPVFPDGRYNPKVVHLTGAWPKGERNVRLTGTFGFVESDGTTTPPGIRDLALRIAVWNMKLIGDESAQRQDKIVEESLRDYRYKLADPKTSSGSFNDPKIDNRISIFRMRRMRAV